MLFERMHHSHTQLPTPTLIFTIGCQAKKEKDLPSVTVHEVRQHMRGPSSFEIGQ